MQGWFSSGGIWHAQTGLLVILGQLALLTILLAAASGSAPSQMSSVERLPLVRYVRSRQFVADARTLVAVVQYMTQSEQAVATNVSDSPFTQRNLVIRTNNIAVVPRA